MTERRPQHSILILTTLGVYLGLVLTGVAPHVAAQTAALTRNFDIRDEIEFKDDLDRGPDDDRSELSDSVGVFLQDVEQLIAAFSVLQSRGKFDPASNWFEASQTVQLPCAAGNTAGSYAPKRFINANADLQPALERLSKQLSYGYSLGDCVANAAFPDRAAVESNSNFRLDRKALSLEISIRKHSHEAADLLAAALPDVFRQFKATGPAELRSDIIDRTTVRAKGDQVFIVTRLPRAALDEHLAFNAKQRRA